MSYKDENIEFSEGINIITGANNSGKSTIMKSLANLQYNHAIYSHHVRNNEEVAQTVIKLDLIKPEDFNKFKDLSKEVNWNDIHSLLIHWHLRNGSTSVSGGYIYDINKKLPIQAVTLSKRKTTVKIYPDVANSEFNLPPDARFSLGVFNRFPESEDEENFIYPFFSKRRIESYTYNMDSKDTYKVSITMNNLVSKIFTLCNGSHPENKKFNDICEQILGFRVGIIPAFQQTQGVEVGIFTKGKMGIPIRSMGDGVVNILGFLTVLLTEDNKLHLIEELENDIHPKALKALLELIVEKSKNNQFIVSTHSHIVLKYLGATENSRLIYVESDKVEFENTRIPTSQIKQIPNVAEKRIEILEKLGYEFEDYELYEAYLILEESSAESIIRDYLIPIFVPRLYGKLKTIGATGVDDLQRKAWDFGRLFVFIHTNSIYKDRAWVIADGDEAGKKCIEEVKEGFKTWNQKHFLNFDKHNFEEYYPERFANKTDKVLQIKDRKDKKKAKGELAKEVINWALDNPKEAKAEFEKSAKEVIGILRDIEKQLGIQKRKK